MLVLQILQQSLQLGPVCAPHGIVVLDPLLLHEDDRRRPVRIIEVDGTDDVLEVKNILPRHLLRPALHVLVIIPPPQIPIVILLVEHRLDEERVEKVRPPPSRIPRAQLLVAIREAVLKEVVDDLVVEPLSGEERLHGPALDAVGLVAGEYVLVRTYAPDGRVDDLLLVGRQGTHELRRRVPRLPFLVRLFPLGDYFVRPLCRPALRFLLLDLFVETFCLLFVRRDAGFLRQDLGLLDDLLEFGVTHFLSDLFPECLNR
mmetsp:Transcript_8212/g.20199  ORF Transcript_8212/g.20199 Transcript_8212/m.20199 type:complete len:259 (+) Transcript_8212:372-1148(+)